MRLILYSVHPSDEVQMEVLALRELRGWEALSFGELADESYCGHGFKCSPEFQRQILITELLAGSAVAVMPGEEPADVLRLAHVCAFMGAPILHFASLPTTVPEGREEEDLFRQEFAAARFFAAPAAHTPAPQRPRRPWEWARDLWTRIRRWEERVNAHIGPALKNPASRALRENAPRPRPYKLHTGPPPAVS